MIIFQPLCLNKELQRNGLILESGGKKGIGGGMLFFFFNRILIY